MIIDSHTHLLKDEMPVSEFVAEFTRCGITMVMLADLGDWSKYPSSEVIRSANERAMKYADESAGRIKAMAYINPMNPDWNEALTRCLGRVIGVKLWISLCSDNRDYSETIKVLQISAKHNMPVLIHTWNHAGGNSPGEVNIREFATLARAVPKCRMIAAHAGGNWRQSVGVLKGLSNVWVDICGGYPAAGIVEALAEDIGVDRILFGSDAVGRSYPSQYAKALFADITDEQRELINSGNAVKLYNLTGLPPEPEPASLRPLNELPDINEDHFCFCGNWPFADLGCKSAVELENVLAENEISKAYTGSFDAMFKHNMIRANRQFITECVGLKRVKPLAVLNPVICNCPEAAKDAAASGFAGAILYPTLHDWRLDDAKHVWLFKLCAELGLKLWINCGIDDPRYRNQAFSHRAVATDELLAFISNAPDNTYVFQGMNAASFDSLFEKINGDSRFKFDLSRLTDSCFKLREHLAKYGTEKLVTGSEFPFRDIRTVRYCAQRV